MKAEKYGKCGGLPKMGCLGGTPPFSHVAQAVLVLPSIFISQGDRPASLRSRTLDALQPAQFH
jgi:hypothetical protein